MTAQHDTLNTRNNPMKTPLTPPDFVRYLNVRSASGASFSPDGQRLAFLTDITGVAEVWSVAVTPEECQETLRQPCPGRNS